MAGKGISRMPVRPVRPVVRPVVKSPAQRFTPRTPSVMKSPAVKKITSPTRTGAARTPAAHFTRRGGTGGASGGQNRDAKGRFSK